VKYGNFPGHSSSAVSLAFESLRQTSAGHFSVLQYLGPQLYASGDFIKTVQRAKGTVDDQFLKPVHWALSNVHNSDLLLLSQHEANELLPEVRVSQKTKLHVYSARTTRAMRSFGDLTFLTTGKGHSGQQRGFEIIRDLELFSGSLYFESFPAYESFRHFLGLVTACCGDIPEGRVSTDGFVDEKTRKLVGWPTQSPFRYNPLPLLSSLLNLRSKGHGYPQTHVGMIMGVRPLRADHF
jgi:hypothetical protein